MSASTSTLKCAIKSCLISHTSVYLCVSSDAQSMKNKHLYSLPCFPLLSTKPLGLWVVRIMSVMMFQPWDVGPKWSHIATHPWLIHKVIGDEGLCPDWQLTWLKLCVSVGPNSSSVTGPFSPVTFLLSSEVPQQLSQVTPAHKHSVMIFISKMWLYNNDWNKGTIIY